MCSPPFAARHGIAAVDGDREAKPRVAPWSGPAAPLAMLLSIGASALAQDAMESVEIETVEDALAALAPAGKAFDRVAVVAPLGDRSDVLGRQAVRGAALALGFPDGGSGGVTPQGIELVVVSDPCRGGDDAAEDGARVAAELVEADVDAAVGFLCWGTLRAALAEGTLDGIPLISSGVRAAELTDRARAEGWDVWRLAPRAGAEAEAAAAYIFERWRDRPYAILDDGTIYGRELAGRVSEQLLARGSEPVLSDTFRPAVSRQFGLARRLEAAGPNALFVAGERRDVAIIARDAVEAGLELTIMGGDALRAVDDDVALPPGVQGIVLGPALAGGYEAPTRAAMEALTIAAARARVAQDAAQTDEDEADDALQRMLATGTFQTVLGPVTFDALGDVQGNPFVHSEWNGREWVPSDRLPGSPRPTADDAVPPEGGAIPPDQSAE